MSREKEVPLGYQITVGNIFTIGTKVMSDYFISFCSQNTDSKWTSPLVHGKITKDNRDYPWIFIVDTPQLVVNFHEFDDKRQTDRIIGSTPLLLLKKEGEQQFLVFGCIKQNQGRKVAEIEFEYVQCTVLKQVPSSTSNKKSNLVNQSNQNKRTSIDNTIYIENYGQNDNSNVDTPKNEEKGLNIIPEESEHDNFKDSMMHRDQVNDDRLDTLIEDERVASPSNLETLKVETNRNKFVGEDSNIELNILKEIEDTADRWYRSNFGKDKPGNLQNYDFQNNENSRILTVQYEKDFEYLNELSFTNPHMQLKNIIINSDKKPKVIEIYSLDLDSSTVQKRKIATIESPDGYKKDWNNVIRLPKDKKAYGIEIITKQKERLQGLIIRDANYCKNKTDIYNKSGKKVGNATFNLKEVKKIQIQTLELMDEKPQLEQLPVEKELNELDKSFIKSFENRIAQDKSSNILLNEPYIVPGTTYQSLKPKSVSLKSQLMNEVYMNRSEDSEQPVPRSASMSRQQDINSYKDKHKPTQREKGISNKPYLNRMENNSLGNKHTSFRKNRFEPVVPATQEYQITKTPSEQASPALQNYPQTEESLRPTSNEKADTLMKSKASKGQSNASGNSSNQFLKQYIQSPVEEKKAPIASSKTSTIPHSASKQLRNKIDEIKKMGQDLSKFAKVFPSNKLNKNLKYKTVIFHDDEQDNLYQDNIRRNSPSHNSDAQSTSHKKTYREPINATPTFQTLFNKPTQEQKIQKLKLSIAKLQKQRLSVHEEVPKKKKQMIFLANDDLILVKPKKPQLRIQIDQDHDDQQDSPIKKQPRKSNLSVVASAIIDAQKQKNSRIQSNNALEEANTIRLAKEKQITELGINTERMAIVNNILQSSYVPTTPTQKRASPEPIKELSPIDHEKWEKQSLKEELGSFFDSVLNENNHEHKTKYSSQTIQPTTQQIKRINFLINTISVNYNESAFGGKFVKICIPNKYSYVTEVSHSHLNWKCSGFLFNHISEHEDLYVQLYNDPHSTQQQLGRAIIPSTQFKNRKNQSIIRAYLTKENKVVGEVVIGYQPATKNLMLLQKELPQKRHTSIDYKTIEEPEGIKPSEKETTPIRKAKKGKRNKSSGDSLTQFLKMNRKQKINRYIVNQYSRANIESRINPIRMKKYTAGKNITIGRDVRFPFSAEDEHYKDVPGPGTYEAKSEFKRYRHGEQLLPK